MFRTDYCSIKKWKHIMLTQEWLTKRLSIQNFSTLIFLNLLQSIYTLVPEIKTVIDLQSTGKIQLNIWKYRGF